MQIRDRLAKACEYLYGGYRYPVNLVGRTLDSVHFRPQSDILVFASHPDDEALGLGTVLARHALRSESITIVFTTNGRQGNGWMTPKNRAKEVASMRYLEACHALSVIGLRAENIICLGYPDSGLYRYPRECLRDVMELIDSTVPTRVYTHCPDGGHVDHDVTGLIVRAACSALAYDELYEWASYNGYTAKADRRFALPNGSASDGVEATDIEIEMRNQMLDAYQSQVDVLRRHRAKGEAVRPATLTPIVPETVLYPEPLKRRALASLAQLSWS